MNTVHLDEEQLQQYAITGVTGQAEQAHLAGCNDCRLELRAYQLLYQSLQETETPVLELKTEELIPFWLPETTASERNETRYLYGFLLAPLVLLIVWVVAFWTKISWVFIGIAPVAIAVGLLLFFAILYLQLRELYTTYRKKLNALNAASIAT